MAPWKIFIPLFVLILLVSIGVLAYLHAKHDPHFKTICTQTIIALFFIEWICQYAAFPAPTSPVFIPVGLFLIFIIGDLVWYLVSKHAKSR